MSADFIAVVAQATGIHDLPHNNYINFTFMGHQWASGVMAVSAVPTEYPQDACPSLQQKNIR